MLSPFTHSTYSTLVACGMSAAAGALSSPMLEQLTTQDDWGPASSQLQLTGQGLHVLPPSPCGPEPHTSRQQSATSRLGKKLNLGTQTPCFRLDKVCPFPQGIAHSHRIASDGVKSSQSGKDLQRRDKDTHTRPSFLSCEETKAGKGWVFHAVISPCVFFSLLVGSPSSENLTEPLHNPFREKKKKVWENFLSPPLSTWCSSLLRR